MKTYRELLTAGVPLQMAIGGKSLFITHSDPGDVLTIEFVTRQSEGGKLEFVGKGTQVSPVLGFEGIKITSPLGGNVTFVITDGGFDLKFNKDEVIIGNLVGDPVPVVVVDALAVAKTVDNLAPVAVADVAGLVAAAIDSRRGLRIKNTGLNPVAIGGAGVTFANAAVVIQAGETWNENEAAAAAWYAICDAAQASTLNLQSVNW